MSLPESPWCQELTEPYEPDAGDLAACFSGQWEHNGLNPLLISGILRGVLKHCFSVPENIEDPALRNYIWRPGKDTGIAIESIHRRRDELVEKRPAVIIKRNAVRNMRVARNDAQVPDGQGNMSYATFWVGSHTLFCIHGEGASTEILATEVQRSMTQFGPAIANTFNFFKFQCTEYGVVSEIEEATESFVVPITIGWTYQELWRLTEVAPLASPIVPSFS